MRAIVTSHCNHHAVVLQGGKPLKEVLRAREQTEVKETLTNLCHHKMSMIRVSQQNSAAGAKRYYAAADYYLDGQEMIGHLEVQKEALRRYAAQAGGKIVKFFKIALTASKGEERKTFRELIAYAKKNAAFLDGLCFYKMDRASRNLFDYVELERLESEYNLPFILVSQPTENTPAGRIMCRTLANMASVYTEQQSVDVREGLSRRIREGWFIG